MKRDDLARQYATGIAAAKAKMVARVGQAEADKWEQCSIASAPMYAAQYYAMLHGGGRSLGAIRADRREAASASASAESS